MSLYDVYADFVSSIFNSGCFDLNALFLESVFQPYFREYQLFLQLHSLIYPIHYLISQI
jgi:hypothetical protein